MIIDPKSLMYGIPVLTVRKILRRFPFVDGCRYGIGYGRVSELSEDEADRVVCCLEADGYLTKERWSGDREYAFAQSQKGHRFAMASARPLKRSTADRMLKALMGRAEAINADSSRCMWVGALVLFGSYLDESAQILGDLDVAFVSLCRQLGEAGEDLAAQQYRRALREGRRVRAFETKWDWAEREFLLALKA